jgi:phenylacetate-CoA ligase
MVEADRHLLEHNLHVPVVSTYQADEALRIAFQCELRGGFHLSLDDVAVRVVDADGRTVGPGETGEIVLSNLTNHATVLLNYKLGDRVTFSTAPCACGRSLPMLERIDGRADDLIQLPSGDRLPSFAVMQDLQAVPGVVRVQLVQEELTRFVLHVVATFDADWTIVRMRLEHALRGFVGESADLAVDRVQAIAPEPGGKIRAVISRCRGDR